MWTAMLTAWLAVVPSDEVHLKLPEVRPDGRALAPTAVLSATEPTLVSVFTTWCEPCNKEVPTLNKLASETRGRGLRMVSVSIDDDPPGKVSAWMRKMSPELPVFYADALVRRGASPLGDVSLVPSTVLLSPQGKVLRRWMGYVPERLLRAAIEPLLTPAE